MYLIIAIILIAGIILLLNQLVKLPDMQFDNEGNFIGWQKSKYRNLFDYLIHNIKIK